MAAIKKSLDLLGKEKLNEEVRKHPVLYDKSHNPSMYEHLFPGTPLNGYF